MCSGNLMALTPWTACGACHTDVSMGVATVATLFSHVSVASQWPSAGAVNLPAKHSIRSGRSHLVSKCYNSTAAACRNCSIPLCRVSWVPYAKLVPWLSAKLQSIILGERSRRFHPYRVLSHAVQYSSILKWSRNIVWETDPLSTVVNRVTFPQVNSVWYSDKTMKLARICCFPRTWYLQKVEVYSLLFVFWVAYYYFCLPRKRSDGKQYQHNIYFIPVNAKYITGKTINV